MARECGFAVPLASLAGSSQALQQGIALRDPAAFETLAKVRGIAFDKTGTLTRGQHQVVHAALRQGEDLTMFQAMLHSAVSQSEHPLASGLLDWANKAETATPPKALHKVFHNVLHLEEHPGKGQQVTFQNGEQWWLGSAAWIEQQLGVPLPDNAQHPDYAFASQVVVANSRGWLATLYCADQPVSDAKASLAELQRSGYIVALISGDPGYSVSLPTGLSFFTSATY